MENSDLKDLLNITIILVLTFAIVFGCGFFVSYISCSARTEDIGVPHRWGAMSGCRIEASPGQWVPLDNWRKFD